MRTLARAGRCVGLLLVMLGLLHPFGPRVAWAGSAGGNTQVSTTSHGDTLTVDRILVELDSFRLYTFNNDRLISRYRIAVGMDTSPTPTGRFRVVNKLKDPWYTPEDKPAKAPGPDNPLGTRWMGIDKPTYGLHGTRAPGTIGTRASDGCIRLRNEDAERLYRRVRRGTVVEIRQSSGNIPPAIISGTPVTYASLTRQGAYASLPSPAVASSKPGAVLKANATGRPVRGRCRLDVPLEIPYIASCFLRGDGCSPALKHVPVIPPASPNGAVQHFPGLSSDVLHAPESNTVPDRREVFTSGGASEAANPLTGRSARLEGTRLSSFAPPASCDAEKGRTENENQQLVCFIFSEPSGSRGSSSPVRVTDRTGEAGGDAPDGAGSSTSSESSSPQLLFGEEFAAEPVEGSRSRSDPARQRVPNIEGIEKSFTALEAGERCAGGREPGRDDDLQQRRVPPGDRPTLWADGGPGIGHHPK